MYKTDMLAKLKANNANSTVIPIQFDGLDSDHIQKTKKRRLAHPLGKCSITE
jgi:hypothetical protein